MSIRVAGIPVSQISLAYQSYTYSTLSSILLSFYSHLYVFSVPSARSAITFDYIHFAFWPANRTAHVYPQRAQGLPVSIRIPETVSFWLLLEHAYVYRMCLLFSSVSLNRRTSRVRGCLHPDPVMKILYRSTVYTMHKIHHPSVVYIRRT